MVSRGGGDVSQLFAADDSRLEVSAAGRDGGYVSEFYAHATMTAEERSGLRKLTVESEGHASRNAAAVSLSVYNWTTGTWRVVDGPRTGVTSDRPFTWSETASPQAYVSAGGEVRFNVRATSASSFRTRTDLVRFGVER